MWRELITELHGELEPIADVDPGPTFFPGATPDELSDVAQQLGAKLPDSLREMLSETNGVYVNYGQPLIWKTAEIVKRNLDMRTPAWRKTYMSFDHLLFFANLGADGIQFAFGITEDDTKFWHVFEWNPYNDSREQVAQSLQQYVEWQLGTSQAK